MRRLHSLDDRGPDVPQIALRTLDGSRAMRSAFREGYGADGLTQARRFRAL